jgi:hypothetical protein
VGLVVFSENQLLGKFQTAHNERNEPKKRHICGQESSRAVKEEGFTHSIHTTPIFHILNEFDNKSEWRGDLLG